MRELSIYYCPLCGFYGYFQLSKNAVCPKCDEKMLKLPMKYQDFMSMDCEERDELLAKYLAAPSSLADKLSELHKQHNNREIIGFLYSKIEDLESENKKLADKVDWMHDMIWDMIHKNRALEEKLRGEEEEKPCHTANS